VGWGKSKGRMKARKLGGQEKKNSLVSRRKRKQNETNDAKPITHHLPWVG